MVILVHHACRPNRRHVVDLDVALADQLDRLARLVRIHRRDVVARHDLTPVLSRALLRLESEQPRAMADLAEILQCDPSNVTGIVDRLEAKALVERRTADHDRRAKTVAVTATGRRMAKRLRIALAVPPVEIAALDHDDQRALCELLTTVLEGTQR